MQSSDMPTALPGRAGSTDLLAGALCLDFVNTVEPRVEQPGGLHPREYLTDYGELVAWSRHAAIITEAEAQQLRAGAERDPRAAQDVLIQTVRLREAIYRVFSTVARRQGINRDELDALSAAYADALAHAQLVTQDDHFVLKWEQDGAQLARPLWPIAQSAIELLTRGEMRRVKECLQGEDGCGWMFYDTSKNNSRRWCNMDTCGMEAKERRRGKRNRSKAKPSA